jgi:hypothetical protein
LSGSSLAPHVVYIAYPDFGLGHTLISCLSCGEIYAIDTVAELYSEPQLKVRLQNLNCIKCNSNLSDVYSEYPNAYVFAGEVHQFDPPVEYPTDETMIVKEFYSIYS